MYLSSCFFPCLISAATHWMSTILRHMVCHYCKFRMQVRNVLRMACLKCRTQKIAKNLPSGHHHTTLSGYIFATKARIDNQKKNLLSSRISSTCPHNMVNFGPLASEIGPVVWGTPANLNGFRFLAALLHGTVVAGVSHTVRHWTEGATYIWQSGHHVGHWPTFLGRHIFTAHAQKWLFMNFQLTFWHHHLNPWTRFPYRVRYFGDLRTFSVDFCIG